MKQVPFGNIVQRIDLTLYAPDADEKQLEKLGSYKMYAWINPPPEVRKMRDDIVARYREMLVERKALVEQKDVEGIENLTDKMNEELGPQNDKLLSLMLSQHEDGEDEDSHWSPEEIRAYRRDGDANETDPEFMDFILDEVWRLADAHLDNMQKKIRRRCKVLLKAASPLTQNSSQSLERAITNTS